MSVKMFLKDDYEKTVDISDEGNATSSSLLNKVLSQPSVSDEEYSLTSKQEDTSSEDSRGVVIGELVKLVGGYQAFVDFPANPADKPVQSISTVQIDQADVGRKVCLAFEAGNLTNPIILGILLSDPNVEQANNAEENKLPQRVDVRVDGHRLTFVADKEIVLRCGNASITLSQDGKILVRGKYIQSRSSGINRIQGGSVRIN